MKDSPLTVDLIKKCATSTGAKSATVDGSNTTKPKPDGNGKGTESSPAPTNSGYQVGNSAESMSVGLSYMMALILLN
ncbi:hypothetical protein BC833DRAFT_597509 [Globomyces pollinis-pini]|nr:hypothetical protein BC833DRAFT_597509 [Globomyces pollinis-pini]